MTDQTICPCCGSQDPYCPAIQDMLCRACHAQWNPNNRKTLTLTRAEVEEKLKEAIKDKSHGEEFVWRSLLERFK